MIPRNPDDVTADWLSGVLGTEVRTLELNPIGTGQTGATYRISVGYSDEVGLPASFAIKLFNLSHYALRQMTKKLS